MRCVPLLATLALATGAAACGSDDGSDDGGGGPSGTSTLDDAPRDGGDTAARDRVRESGELSRAAVTAGGRSVEAVILENCLATQFASFDAAAAPPCRPVARVGVLPKLVVEGGETVQIDLGAEAGDVFVRVADTRGDPAAKEFVKDSAEASDDERRTWTIKLPEDIEGANRMDITITPNATDSGQVSLAVRLGP